LAKIGWRIAVALGSLLILGLWLVFMPHTPTLLPREVERAKLSCGELLLTQTFTGTVEPYIVWVYFRAPGAPEWDQYFVDFEAPYWWGGLDARADGAMLTFYGRRIGDFACEGPVFRLRNRAMPIVGRVSDPFDINSAQRGPLPKPWFRG
jgi:hypothetical protein